MFLLDERLLQRVSNHPVHILNSEGDLSPSAFIPFCFFGNNMIDLGIQIDDFEVPVCNIFVAKNWNDQLCYELDLNSLKNKGNINEQLKKGIFLMLDFNEDRQFEKDVTKLEKVINVQDYLYGDKDKSVQVHIDSIGK